MSNKKEEKQNEDIKVEEKDTLNEEINEEETTLEEEKEVETKEDEVAGGVNKILIDKGQFEALLARVEQLETGNTYLKNKPKRVDEHFAWLRVYYGRWLHSFDGFANKKDTEGRNVLYVKVNFIDEEGEVTKKTYVYTEFIAETDRRFKVKLIKRTNEVKTDLVETVSKVNLNEHFEKNPVSREIDMEVTTDKDTYLVEFLEGPLEGKQVEVSSEVLNC